MLMQLHRFTYCNKFTKDVFDVIEKSYVTNKQTTTTRLFQIKYSLQSLCPQLAKAFRGCTNLSRSRYKYQSIIIPVALESHTLVGFLPDTFQTCFFRAEKLVEWVKSMNWRIQQQNSLLKLRHAHENKLLMNNSKLVVSVREKKMQCTQDL